MKTPDNDSLPSAWDEDHVQRVFAHYEAQVDEPTEIADDPALIDPEEQLVLIEVPAALVTDIHALIARYQSEASEPGKGSTQK